MRRLIESNQNHYGKEANDSLQKDAIYLVYPGRADIAIGSSKTDKSIADGICPYFSLAFKYQQEPYAVGTNTTAD